MIELLGGRVRFGKLTFIGEGSPSRAMRRGLFRCDCGTEKPMGIHHVVRGEVFSCGCEGARRAAARFTKHGGYRTPEYKSWSAMLQRCSNPKVAHYADYGGRGITVCPEWQGSEGYHRFVAYLGPRPNGMTLDRIDSNGNYEPGNVRWATPKRQQNNRRSCKILTLGGVSMTQREWTDLRGWGKNVISERLRKGWNLERALTEPVHPHRKPAPNEPTAPLSPAVKSTTMDASALTLAVLALAAAVIYHAMKGPNMADFSRLNAALESIATEITALAEAIRNPASDNNDQTQVDDLAGRAEAAAEALRGLKVEEDAEDTGTVSTPTPTPTPDE